MDADAVFKASGLAAEDLLFHKMTLREELGRLPECRLELLRESDGKPILDATKLLGKEASVALKIKNGVARYHHGLVTHFEHGGARGAFDVYRIVLRPWLWQLTLSADCRVFQDKTAVEILDTVFGEYGSAGSVTKKLTGTFHRRPYTVQFRESDFNFVSRLMEDEGIYYYFKHEENQYKLVLCNGATSSNPAIDNELNWYDEQASGTETDKVIVRWSRAHTLQSLSYAHTDFAAESPATDLLAKADRNPMPPYPKTNDLAVFGYPGRHDDLAMTGVGGKVQLGKNRAQIEVDRFESEHSVATGLTKNRGLAVGNTFTFGAHPDAGEYLVTSSVTEMEFAGYEARFDKRTKSYLCRFNAVPRNIHFQPRRQAERPLSHGPQTAIVMGPQGDEIHTDKYGRVKVRFHWDRVAKQQNLLDKSSCWVRVSHPWASKQFGMVALPRVGDEVVVDFLAGDLDRPLVTGRVYNGDNMPPWELPKHATISGIKTRSSKGGAASDANELRFDDLKGSEYIWFQAQKDFHRLVKHDSFESVQNNQWLDVTKNTSLKIGENATTDIGKAVKLRVGADTDAGFGADMNLGVKGAFNLKVAQPIAIDGAKDIALTSTGKFDVNVGQTLKLTATAAIHIKANSGVMIDGGTQLTIKAGAGFVTLGPEGVTISGPIVKVNSGGSASPATDADKASPPTPKDPEPPTPNEDPLAKGG